MSAYEQEPEVEFNTGPLKDALRFKHPAFGQISVSRVSGGNVSLYGSDFKHQHYVTVTIHRSELMRDLARDWAFPKEELIKIEMSEVQWAQFVSSFGQGSGVQCTIERINLERMPRIPHRDEAKLYQTEHDAALSEAIKHLKDAIDEAEKNTVGLSKTKQDALLKGLREALRKLDDTAPFIAKQFDKHVEKRVERAKTEINAWATSEIMKRGLQALGAEAQPQITDGKED